MFFINQTKNSSQFRKIANKRLLIKARFPLGEFVRANRKKVGTVPTCSRRIFSPTNFNQSRCRILVFASRRANKFAKWKMGLTKKLKRVEISTFRATWFLSVIYPDNVELIKIVLILVKQKSKNSNPRSPYIE